jgi:hypothetical protein
VLDEAKRQKIVALLSNGSSRRVAAGVVGCAPSTITRTAARDPQFAGQVARAARNVEIESLRAIRAAGQDKRHWRAAAWLLERNNPSDFAVRSPKTFTQAEVAQLLASVAEMLVGELPEDNCRRAIEWLDQVMLGLREEFAAAEDGPLAGGLSPAENESAHGLPPLLLAQPPEAPPHGPHQNPAPEPPARASPGGALATDASASATGIPQDYDIPCQQSPLGP